MKINIKIRQYIIVTRNLLFFMLISNDYSKGQLRSYMRTPINYYLAQTLSEQGYPAIVMGTGNMDEDGYLAYFCKYWDGAVDVQLILDLHKSEVFKVGKYLSIPKNILNQIKI